MNPGRCLGMPLTFPRRYRQLDADAANVIFPGQDGEKTVTCRVSTDVLRAWLGADAAGADLLAAFDRNRARIESLAARKYELANSTDAVSITLTPADL
jgi:hypothetical protein